MIFLNVYSKDEPLYIFFYNNYIRIALLYEIILYILGLDFLV